MGNRFAQTIKLTWFYLKKDLIKIILWTIALVAMSAGLIAYFPTLYSTTADKMAIAATMINPSMIAMVGPMYGVAPYTIGALAAQQMFLFTIILASIMNISFALKNSRQQEEEGILELLQSFPIGRYSNTLAIFIELLIVNLICAILITIGFNITSIDGVDWYGAFIYAFAMQGVGFVFGVFTLVFAQLTNNTRTASFFSYGFFGSMYLLRAITDINNDNYTWLSPLGWATKTEVFVNNKAFPLFLIVIAAIILLFIALYLNKIRDIGAGLLPNKAGRVKASAFLGKPFGFSFRLERFTIIAWIIIIFITGASYASIFGDLDSFLENDTIASVVQADDSTDIAVAFIPMLTLIMSILLSIPCISIINKLYAEEKIKRIEQIYALPVSRKTMLNNHLILSITLAAICLLVGALSVWSISTTVMSEPIAAEKFLMAALAFFPAVLVMIGVTIFLLGWYAKGIKLVWLYLTFSFMVVYFGNLLKLPEWIKNLSVFGLIPRVPVEDFDIVRFIIMLIVAIVLIILGYIGYKKRDIA